MNAKRMSSPTGPATSTTTRARKKRAGSEGAQTTRKITAGRGAMTQQPIRRIGLELPMGASIDAMSEAIISLAAKTTAELFGLFVQEEDLLRFAGLPFSFEICRTTNVRRPVSAGVIAQELEQEAAKARRTLEGEAARAGVRCSFKVLHGAVAPALAQSLTELDVLVVRSSPARLGVVTRVLPEPRQPVISVLDRTPAGRRALQLGIDLARELSRPLHVLVSAANQAGASRLITVLKGQASGLEPPPALSTEVVIDGSLDALLARAASRRPVTLILPYGSKPDLGGAVGSPDAAQAISTLRAHPSCPIVLTA